MRRWELIELGVGLRTLQDLRLFSGTVANISIVDPFSGLTV